MKKATPRPRPWLAQRLITAARQHEDAVTQRALAMLLGSAARLCRSEEPRGLDPLVFPALRSHAGAAEWFAGIAMSATEAPKLRGWLDEHTGIALDEAPAEGIDADVARKIVAKAEREVAGRRKETPPPKETGMARGGDAPQAPSQVDVELGDGVTIHVRNGASIAKREGEEIRVHDEADPTIYGEEIEQGKELYAISLHTIECLETSDLSLIDDQLAWAGQGVASFHGGRHPPIVVTSKSAHSDVVAGHVLSDAAELVVPRREDDPRTDDVERDDEDFGGHLLLIGELFLVNRFAFTAAPDGRNGVRFSEFTPFDLDQFEAMYCDLSLFEDDSDVREMIEEVTALLQAIADVASKIIEVTQPGSSAVTIMLRELTESDALTRVKQLLLELFGSDDSFGACTIRVNQGQIRDGFTRGPVHAFPEGSSAPDFHYVLHGTKFHYTGLGGRYVVTVRYERHAATR